MIFVNGNLVVNERYPNGELLINKEKLMDSALVSTTIKFYYRTDADLMELWMVTKYVKEVCAEVILDLKYMPYSRMDRRETFSDAFTLRYIADFINALGFEQINIFEPHSDVCVALLNADVYRFLPDAAEYLKKKKLMSDEDYLFFPDAGAQKKYVDILPNPYLLGIKKRDFKTGKITDYKAFNPNQDLDFQGADVGLDNDVNVFIVDDLVAKGTTAYNAALAINKLFVIKPEINLVVAHCEDSIFDGKLLLPDSPINKVYTTDSILTKKHEKIVLIKC